MELEQKIEEDSKVKKLKKKIINEYICVIATILILNLLLPFLTDVLIADNRGLDGIGYALALLISWRILTYIITIIFFVINPIRILRVYNSDFKEIISKKKKVMYRTVILLPILLSVLVLFDMPISDFIYNLKYETGKNDYKKAYDEYKTPKDFRDELDKRGFIYNAEFDLSRLNKKYKIDDKEFSKYYYEEASVMPLFTKHDFFSDSKDDNDIITFDSDKKAPGYVYNTILYLYGENEELQYAPVSRYAGHDYLSGNFYPFFEDYYIECKILYVDEDIYAILGVGQSYDVENYFDSKKKEHNTMYTYPYNMVISEKDSITTFFDNKYYPNGGIENIGDRFEMTPNTTKKDWSEYYPIRKVDKLDVKTINDIAIELQNGILKDSIKNHFNKNK